MVLLSARKTAKIKEETLRAKLALPPFQTSKGAPFLSNISHQKWHSLEVVFTAVQLHQVPTCLNSVPLLKMAGSSQKVQRPFLWFLSTVDTGTLLFNPPKSSFT